VKDLCRNTFQSQAFPRDPENFRILWAQVRGGGERNSTETVCVCVVDKGEKRSWRLASEGFKVFSGKIKMNFDKFN
jgi:hypothetical protein